MPSKTSRESRDASLSKLDEKSRALEESRLRLLKEIQCIDHTLKEIQAEYRRIVNEALPLLNLPTEVTCMIFDLCVPSHSLVGSTNEKTSLPPEVVISHVCTHWRDVSLNYPQLWTRFYFHADHSKTKGTPLDRFDTYMERSGTQNLELFLDFRMECKETIPYQLIPKALKQVKRWRTVTLRLVENEHMQDPSLDLLAASAPNLEHFAYSLYPPNLYVTTIRTEINSSDPRIFQGGAPKLRYLTLNSSSQIQLLPFRSNITTLRIETEYTTPIYSWEIFLEILSVPSLVNLSTFHANFAVPARNDIRIVTMNNLKHLRYGSHRFMTLLLPFIRAPLLETLCISLDSGMSEQGLVANFGIPKDPYFFPSLQTLILIDCSASSPDLIWSVMQLTKNVTNLHISHDMDDENHFFHGLRKHGPFNDECWPKLTSLTANIYPYDYFETIFEFLLSRPYNTVTLQLFQTVDFELSSIKRYEYAMIQGNCTIKVLTAEEEEEPFKPLWPPGVDCPEYAFKDDPFNMYWY